MEEHSIYQSKGILLHKHWLVLSPFIQKQLLSTGYPKCYNGSNENRSCGHCQMPPAAPYSDRFESLQPGQRTMIYDTNAASPVLAALSLQLWSMHTWCFKGYPVQRRLLRRQVPLPALTALILYSMSHFRCFLVILVASLFLFKHQILEYKASTKSVQHQKELKAIDAAILKTVRGLYRHFLRSSRPWSSIRVAA